MAVTSNGLIVGLLIVAIGLFLYPRVLSSGKRDNGRVSPEETDTAEVTDCSIAIPHVG